MIRLTEKPHQEVKVETGTGKCPRNNHQQFPHKRGQLNQASIECQSAKHVRWPYARLGDGDEAIREIRKVMMNQLCFVGSKGQRQMKQPTISTKVITLSSRKVFPASGGVHNHHQMAGGERQSRQYQSTRQQQSSLDRLAQLNFVCDLPAKEQTQRKHIHTFLTGTNVLDKKHINRHASTSNPSDTKQAEYTRSLPKSISRKPKLLMKLHSPIYPRLLPAKYPLEGPVLYDSSADQHLSTSTVHKNTVLTKTVSRLTPVVHVASARSTVVTRLPAKSTSIRGGKARQVMYMTSSTSEIDIVLDPTPEIGGDMGGFESRPVSLSTDSYRLIMSESIEEDVLPCLELVEIQVQPMNCKPYSKPTPLAHICTNLFRTLAAKFDVKLKHKRQTNDFRHSPTTSADLHPITLTIAPRTVHPHQLHRLLRTDGQSQTEFTNLIRISNPSMLSSRPLKFHARYRSEEPAMRQLWDVVDELSLSKGFISDTESTSINFPQINDSDEDDEGEEEEYEEEDDIDYETEESVENVEDQGSEPCRSSEFRDDNDLDYSIDNSVSEADYGNCKSSSTEAVSQQIDSRSEESEEEEEESEDMADYIKLHLVEEKYWNSDTYDHVDNGYTKFNCGRLRLSKSN